jgi:SAM-dependent methyltransferase
VLGIEPNAEMRKAAAAEPSRTEPTPVYQDGRAEITGVEVETADAVLAAQAFHWFETDTAFQEFRRILKPGGWLILMWNERDETDPATAAYGDVIRKFPDAKRLEGRRGQAGEPLLTCPLFQDRERLVFRQQQMMDETGLIGRAFSASYAPRDHARIQEAETAFRSLFADFQHDGRVTIHYETTVYVGRKPPFA